jgi:hypothetical protein
MCTPNVLSKLAFVFFAALLIIGCDTSDDDDESVDAEKFLGTWTVTSAADMGGDRDVSAAIAALGTLSVLFEDDQSYVLTLVYADGTTPDLNISGIYTVNEASDRVVLSIQLEGLPQVDLNLDYAFVSDTVVEFTADGLTIGLLLGEAASGLEGDVVLTAQKI